MWSSSLLSLFLSKWRPLERKIKCWLAEPWREFKPLPLRRGQWTLSSPRDHSSFILKQINKLLFDTVTRGPCFRRMPLSLSDSYHSCGMLENWYLFYFIMLYNLLHFFSSFYGNKSWTLKCSLTRPLKGRALFLFLFRRDGKTGGNGKSNRSFNMFKTEA